LDPVDYSGVTVQLYKLATIDTSMVRINQEFPSIGVILDQEHEFEHTDLEPIAAVQTSSDGNFELQNIKHGTYNLVATKIGWGTVYRYCLNVDSDSKESQDLEATLYPITNLPPIVSSSFTFKQDHVYAVNSDVSFTGPCTFAGGSTIEMGVGTRVSFYADVITNDTGRSTRFIPQSSAPQGSLDFKWNSIDVYSDNQTFGNMYIKGAFTGISLTGVDCSVSNVYVTDSDNGIFAGALRSSIFRVLFKSISSRAILYNQSAGSNTIRHSVEASVFYLCTEGMRTQGQPIRIKNNYFIENIYGIYSFTNYHIIENNVFDRNDIAIVCNGTIINIRHNDFLFNPVSVTFSAVYYDGPSSPVFNDNNFFQSTGYVLKLVPHLISGNIDARQNYWRSENIPDLIYDALDHPPIIVTVQYIPKRSQPVAEAGINL